MIAVIIFLTLSLTAAIVGSIVIWSMDALRANDIESHPASMAGPMPAPTPRSLHLRKAPQLPPAA